LKRYRSGGKLTRFRIKGKTTPGVCVVTMTLSSGTRFQWNIQVV
jgi:hypothetical protein